MKSVLVVHGTTESQTRKIAGFIANALNDLTRFVNEFLAAVPLREGGHLSASTVDGRSSINSGGTKSR